MLSLGDAGKVGAPFRVVPGLCRLLSSLFAGGGGAGGASRTHDPGLLAWHDQVNPAALAPAPSHTLSVSPSHVHLGLLCPEEGAENSFEGLEFSPSSLGRPLSGLCLGSPDDTACVSCTCPLLASTSRSGPGCVCPLYRVLPALLLWRTPHQHPVPLLSAPVGLFSGPPTPHPLSAQFRDGCVDLGVTEEGRAFLATAGTRGGTPGGWASGENRSRQVGGWGQVQRGSSQRVLSCCKGEGFPGSRPCCLIGATPPGATVAGSGAWAAVSVLGGGRVAAGRGLDQECVSGNVAALPAEGGVGAGLGAGESLDACRSQCGGFGLPL